MKKRILPLLVLLLALLTLSTVYATETRPGYINDVADVLTDEEEAELRNLYDRLEASYGIRAMILTVPSLDGVHVETYANDYYDRNFRGGDGDLLLLVGVGERCWCLLAEGETNRNAYLNRLKDAFLPHLKDNNYGGAFAAYLDKAYDMAPMLSDSQASSGFDFSELLVPVLIALVASLLIAWGVTAAMRRKMKTARPKSEAGDYVKRDSFALREKTDLYLYRTRTRVRVNNNNSSGGSRSGGSRSVRSGRF